MSPADKQSSPISGPASRRLVLLLVVLAVIGVMAVVPRIRNLQEQRLAHASLDELRKLVATPNAGSLPHLLYGEKLVEAGRVTEALGEFQQAEQPLASDQKDAVAERIHARLGYTLTLLGQDDQAKTYLDHANTINDENLLAHLGYGNIFLHRRLYNYAITQYKLAAAIDPQNYEAHYLLGKAYNESAQPQAGIEDLQKAVALAPRFAPGHAELGHANAYQANFAPAVEQFRKALELDPANPDYERALGAALGMSARTNEQYQQAVSVLNKTLQKEPNNVNLIFTLGQLHLRFQNIDEAHRLLKRAIALKPGHTEAWYNLTRVEQLLGNAQEAERDNKIFVRLRALHDNAIVAEKKVSSNIRNPEARLELAHCYRAAGNVVGTYWQLKTALMLKPDDPEISKELAQVEPRYQALTAQRANREMPQDDANTLGPPPPDELLNPGVVPPTQH